MKRRNAIGSVGLCAAALAMLDTKEVMATEDSSEVRHQKRKANYLIERHVVMHDILRDVLDPGTLKKVYLRFGGDCASTYGAVGKAAKHKGNLEGYLKDLPFLDRWQEKAWYDADKKLVTIIGVKRDECVCPMALASKDPNWCHLCCAGHQKAIFEELLGREVEVTMGETRLTGGERCNHFVRIVDNT